MSTSSYRFRQPAWFWAVCGSFVSGLAAAAAFGFILMVTLLFMKLVSPGWSFASGAGTNWPLFAVIAVVIAVGTAIPIIALVSIVSAVTLNAAKKRRSRARSNLLVGYEWAIWATVFVAALAYPWLAKPIGVNAIWGAGYYDSAFPFMLVLAVSLACAYIARPIFYGIVSQTSPTDAMAPAAPDTASSPGGHAPVHA